MCLHMLFNNDSGHFGASSKTSFMVTLLHSPSSIELPDMIVFHFKDFNSWTLGENSDTLARITPGIMWKKLVIDTEGRINFPSYNADWKNSKAN